MNGKNYFLPVLLLSIFVLSLFPITAYGTETRVGSMGGVGYYIRDNSNVFYFPGTIHSYSNQVVAELRSKNVDDYYSIGAFLPLGTDKVFGVYLNIPLYLPTDIITDVTPHLKLNRAASVFYGGKLQNYNYGLMFSIALDKWSEEDLAGEEEKENARYIGISGGLSNEQFDLGVVLDLPSVKWEYEQGEDKWSGLGIGVNGRYFMEKKGKLQLIPVGTFYYGSSTNEWQNGFEGEIDYGLMDIGLGLGLNYQLDDNNLVVLAIEGFGLSQETEDVKDGDETTEKWTTLPGIYLGVESQINSWLIGRLGASQIYQTYSQKINPNVGESTEESDYSSSFNVTFGFGINIGSFVLDASFNEGLLFDGPNFVSGINNNISNRISITYKF